jgi:hypothetical protein
MSIDADTDLTTRLKPAIHAERLNWMIIAIEGGSKVVPVLATRGQVMPDDFNVNEYCEQLSKSNVLSARLIGWTGRWSLFGSYVLCCQCLGSQTVDEAGKPFVHIDGCSALGTGLYPWSELRDVLDMIPKPIQYGLIFRNG